MTLVLAVRHRGRVYLGADSRCAAENVRETMASPKIWRNVRYIVGVAGSGAWISTIRNAVFRGGDPLQWLAGSIVNSGRRIGASYPDTSEDEDSPLEGQVLLARDGRLWHADDALGVQELDTDTAIGSGRDCGLTALRLTESIKGMPLVRLSEALTAAARVRSDVSPPFRWLSTSGKGGVFTCPGFPDSTQLK